MTTLNRLKINKNNLKHNNNKLNNFKEKLIRHKVCQTLQKQIINSVCFYRQCEYEYNKKKTICRVAIKQNLNTK